MLRIVEEFEIGLSTKQLFLIWSCHKPKLKESNHDPTMVAHQFTINQSTSSETTWLLNIT